MKKNPTQELTTAKDDVIKKKKHIVSTYSRTAKDMCLVRALMGVAMQVWGKRLGQDESGLSARERKQAKGSIYREKHTGKQILQIP